MTTEDPTISLEAKLNAFAATLTPDERTVLHEVVHLAADSGEVHGFTMPDGTWGDPCDGGEITFPGTFGMLGNLQGSLAPDALKKLPGKRKPPTVTLKRGLI